MADIEIIFPSKRVHIQPFQLVNLLVTVVTALVTGALMLWKVRRGGGSMALWVRTSTGLVFVAAIYCRPVFVTRMLLAHPTPLARCQAIPSPPHPIPAPGWLQP
jgi:hypothetical protein